MRFFPGLHRHWRFAGQRVGRVMQPAMPFGRHPACLCGTIVNDPAATVLRLVIDVALNIFANAFAKATGVELGADGRPVPPRKDALQDTHAALPFVRWNNWARYSRNLRLWQVPQRSEEHTSELQSLMRISYAVFCL